MAVALIAVAMYVVAELVGGLIDPIAGLVGHGILIVAAINYVAVVARGNDGTEGKALLPLALAVASTMRLLSLGLPLTNVSVPTRVALVGIPALASAVLALRVSALGPRQLGWPPPSWSSQLFVAAVGVPLSYAAFLSLRTEAGVLDSWRGITGAAGVGGAVLSLVVCGALVEELVFRGLVHQGAHWALGRVGVVVSVIVFASTYAGSRPLTFVAVAAVIGMVFAVARERTGSIVGVILAHGVVNVGVFLVWPLVGL